MALLDVSFLCFDPMLSSVFSIKRRTSTTNDFGEPVVTAQVYKSVCRGIVTNATPQQLQRLDAGQMYEAGILVSTKEVIRSAGPGVQPDLITWRGQDYLVISVKNDAHLGGGFYKATAVLLPAGAIQPT